MTQGVDAASTDHSLIQLGTAFTCLESNWGLQSDQLHTSSVWTGGTAAAAAAALQVSFCVLISLCFHFETLIIFM